MRSIAPRINLRKSRKRLPSTRSRPERLPARSISRIPTAAPVTLLKGWMRSKHRRVDCSLPSGRFWCDASCKESILLLIATSAVPEARRCAMSPKVLCIDDQVSGLHVRKIFLEASGYAVLTASTGREGLQMRKSQPMAAVVLDYRMPEMDGGPVAGAIRNN